MRWAWLWFLLFSLSPQWAWAASFDCRKAATAVEKQICGDDQLSALDDALAQAYRWARSVTPDVERSQHEWRQQRDYCKASACLRERYILRTDDLRRIAAENSAWPGGRPRAPVEPFALAPEGQYTLKRLAKECIVFKGSIAGEERGGAPANGEGCRVRSLQPFAVLGEDVYYQALYCLDEGRRVAGGEHCHFMSVEDGAAQAVFVGRRGQEMVRMLLDRSGGGYLHHPAVLTYTPYGPVLEVGVGHGGTAHFNISEYYLLSEGSWKHLDSESWLYSVRLGPGLYNWHGVRPNMRTMTARILLSRDSDQGCCPTGGVLNIKLGIKGQAFVVKSKQLDKGLAYKNQ